jgi:hypothetical protein
VTVEAGRPVVIPDPIKVGRHLPLASDVVFGSPIRFGTTLFGRASLWTGDGPPTTIIGSQVGDEYLDIITGDLYRLDPGA